MDFTSDGSVKLGVIRSSVTATVGKNSYAVSLVNHTPAANSNSVVMFTGARGDTTQCALGTSVIVQNGEVISSVSKQEANIPNNG